MSKRHGAWEMTRRRELCIGIALATGNCPALRTLVVEVDHVVQIGPTRVVRADLLLRTVSA